MEHISTFNANIAKLKECHLNYVKDYQKFLDTDGGVYRFVNKVYQRRTHLGKLHRNKTYEGKTYKGNIYSRILKSDYNFDKKICSVPTLEGILDWEVKYANHYTCKYDWDKCNYNGNRSHMGYTIFPLVIKVPMSYDVAKILFGNEYKVFSLTTITVKVKHGFLSASMTQNFDILKITKKYYKEIKNKLSKEPILLIEFPANKKYRLH